MNVYGDLHHVTKGEFAAFRNDDPGDAREIVYRQHIQEVRKTTPPDKLPIFDDAYRRRWESRARPSASRQQIRDSGGAAEGKKHLREVRAVQLQSACFRV